MKLELLEGLQKDKDVAFHYGTPYAFETLELAVKFVAVYEDLTIYENQKDIFNAVYKRLWLENVGRVEEITQLIYTKVLSLR